MKFAAVIIINDYRVIGGIIHSFLNLAFPGYERSISRPPVSFSPVQGTGYIWRMSLSGAGGFEKEKCLLSLPTFKTRTFQAVAWLLYALSYKAFFGGMDWRKLLIAGVPALICLPHIMDTRLGTSKYSV